ncbi:NmrA domain-containing protein [Mycena venus]|uniref:NmrA domain-containing protein n=1 Tax=Mycena venus TaxID=2733690 RepID=A0A8H6Y577_9AGAR|nr:NmrA domain-containing protein [Mycena venus]
MPIITIFGANGTQGSAVLEAVLADGKYTPRAASRSLDSARCKALIARGVEIVVGNLWDKESLKNAIRGSEAVFGLTNFWDPEIFPADPEGKGEVIQGKNLIDAAKEVDVKFFIWSSLESATKESNGLYKHVYHIDNKVAIEEYLKASGVPYAVVLTGWFAENLWKIGSLQKTDTGYTIPIAKYGPDDMQSATWVARDLGQAALALLTQYTDPSKGVLGKSYPVISFRFTYPEFAAAIAAAINKEVTFTPLETAGLLELDEMEFLQTEVDISVEKFGGLTRTVNLPGVMDKIEEILEALETVDGKEAQALMEEVDPAIEKMVLS